MVYIIWRLISSSYVQGSSSFKDCPDNYGTNPEHACDTAEKNEFTSEYSSYAVTSPVAWLKGI